MDNLQEIWNRISRQIQEGSIPSQFPNISPDLMNSLLVSERVLARYNANSINNISNLLTSVRDTFEITGKINYSSVYNSIDTFFKYSNRLVQSDVQEVSLPSDLIDNLQKIESYLPEDQKEEFHEIVQTEPNQSTKSVPVKLLKILLVSFLLPLLVAIIVNKLPDPALEQIIENQNAQIALSEENNELLQELIDVMERLVDVLEERDAASIEIAETVDALDDDADLPLDLEHTDSQDENSDSQDQTNDF